MKGISCCADCAYYSMKKHRCTRASDEGKPADHFYADCPLPTVTKEQGWISVKDRLPLDKLCEWLSENSINIPCEACQNFSNEYCTAIGDASKPCPKTANDWREAITKWMEEQDD